MPLLSVRLLGAVGWMGFALALIGAGASWAQEPGVAIHPRPVLNIPWTEIAPTLNGRLDDAAWNEPLRLPLPTGDGRTLGEIFLSADHDNLYLASRITADPSSLRSSARGHDARQIEDDDHVEVLIDTLLDARNYRRLIVNPANRTLDEKVIGQSVRDLGWNPNWSSFTRIETQGWVAEMAIPWRSLDVRGAAGLIFGLNVCARSAADPAAAASAVEGAAQDPTRFAAAGLDIVADSTSLRLRVDRVEIDAEGNWNLTLIGRNRQDEAERFWLDYRFGGPNVDFLQGMRGFDIRPYENYPVTVGPLAVGGPGPYSFVAVAHKLGRGGGVMAVTAVTIERPGERDEG